MQLSREKNHCKAIPEELIDAQEGPERHIKDAPSDEIAFLHLGSGAPAERSTEALQDEACMAKRRYQI
jgi:hypothetical protein